MKKIGLSKTLILLTSLFLCVGCNEPTNENKKEEDSQTEVNPMPEEKTNEEIPEEKPQEEEKSNENPPQEPPVEEIIYDEPVDSLEGINAEDLSELITAANKIDGAYTIYSEHYFTEESNNYYRINYGEALEDSWDYTFDNPDSIFFNLTMFDEQYISSHEFTRISSNKYETSNSDAITDFIGVICPQYDNSGFYMTFKRVTIELNDSTEISRIRLYCNTTQVGKLIPSHKDSTKANWYLLFMESLVNPTLD